MALAAILSFWIAAEQFGSPDALLYHSVASSHSFYPSLLAAQLCKPGTARFFRALLMYTGGIYKQSLRTWSFGCVFLQTATETAMFIFCF